MGRVESMEVKSCFVLNRAVGWLVDMLLFRDIDRRARVDLGDMEERVGNGKHVHTGSVY